MSYIVRTEKGYVKVTNLNENEKVTVKRNITEATQFEHRCDAVFFMSMFKNSSIEIV